MAIEGKKVNWENGPIGPGFLMMFAPLATVVLNQRPRRRKKILEPPTKEEVLTHQYEEEVVGLLLLLHAREV